MKTTLVSILFMNLVIGNITFAQNNNVPVKGMSFQPKPNATSFSDSIGTGNDPNSSSDLIPSNVLNAVFTDPMGKGREATTAFSNLACCNTHQGTLFESSSSEYFKSIINAIPTDPNNQ